MTCIPVIDGKTVTPTRIPPGGTATIIILARDLCAAEGTPSGVLRDARGEEISVTVTVQTGGALTYHVTAPAGTVTQDPLLPNVFHFTAPLEPPVPP